MKKISLVSALFILFFAVSCDSGVKFNNPNDINSDAYKGDSDQDTPDDDNEAADDSDSIGPDSDNNIADNDITNVDNDDSGEPDATDTSGDDSNTDQGRKQGELYGECYPNDTCNAGLTCDVENNICIRDNGDISDDSDSGDSTPDDDADTSDANDDSGHSGPDDDTDTGTAELTKEEKCNVLGGNWNASQSKCTKTQNCPDKPANTVWNDNGADGTYTQTWNGEDWIPASYDSSYSLTAGICRYKCADGYTWNNGACEQVQTRTAECKTPLPENTEWNTVDRITQTYTSSGWEPSTTPVYNPEPSENECRYKCVSGYMSQNGSCVKSCTETQCFQSFSCTSTFSSGLEYSVTGHCNPSTCECDQGWKTASSGGETVYCTDALLGIAFDARDNVLCTVCDVDNPPSNYASTGCPIDCYANFCNGTDSANGQGGCYTEHGTLKVYCKCTSGYTMTGSSKYYDDNPTGQCELNE